MQTLDFNLNHSSSNSKRPGFHKFDS